jgi:hypothetical protein
MTEMPEVGIPRIDLLLRRGNRNALRGRVVDGILAAADIPLTPRRDDGQFGRERGKRHLEAHLVVALAGAAVCERVGPDAVGHFDLTLGDEWTRHGGAEEVFPIVDGTGTERRENEVPDELFAEVFHIALLGARRERLVSDAAQLFRALSDVGGDADDACVVVLPQPRDDNGRVEAARIGEDNGTRHGCSF